MIEIKIKKRIKDYSYSLNNDILEIYVVDLNDNEYIIATICDCADMKDFELGNLAQEIIEEHDYILIDLGE